MVKKIERTEVIKYLGLLIDEELTFEHHVDHIKKILPMAFSIRRIRHRINEKIAVQICFAHIYSHLIFMNPLWSAANNERLNELFVIQKKALKFMKKASSHTFT